MKINKAELKSKYGIDLPNGKYRITVRDGFYTVNTVKDDTEGCILVGKNDVVGMVTDSKNTFLRLYNKMYAAHQRGEAIEITIK